MRKENTYKIDEIIATMPYILGYYPTDCLVLCAVHEFTDEDLECLTPEDIYDTELRTQDGITVGPIGRIDLWDEHIVEQLFRRIGSVGSKKVLAFVVGYDAYSKKEEKPVLKDTIVNKLYTIAYHADVVLDGVWFAADTRSQGFYYSYDDPTYLPVGEPFSKVAKHVGTPANSRDSLYNQYRLNYSPLPWAMRNKIRSLTISKGKIWDDFFLYQDVHNDLFDRYLAGDEFMSRMENTLERIASMTNHEIANDYDALFIGSMAVVGNICRDLVSIFAFMPSTSHAFSKLMFAVAGLYNMQKRDKKLTEKFIKYKEMHANALTLYALCMLTQSITSHAIAAISVAMEYSPNHALAQLLLKIISCGKRQELLRGSMNLCDELIEQWCLTWRRPQ